MEINWTRNGGLAHETTLLNCPPGLVITTKQEQGHNSTEMKKKTNKLPFMTNNIIIAQILASHSIVVKYLFQKCIGSTVK